MPLFVTVTAGTTISASTTLDAATLNLLGTPSVDVTGTVDGGSVSITAGSVPLTALANQAASTLVGNATAASATPTAITSTDLTILSGVVNIGDSKVTTAKLVDSSSSVTGVTYAKIQHVNDAKLLGRSSGSAGIPQEISVGSNLTLASGTLTALRPAFASTNVLTTSGYAVVDTRLTPTEITALTTSITTQTTASKVLVSFNISYSISAYNDQTCRYVFIITRAVGSGSDFQVAIPSSPLTNQVYGIKALDPIFYTYQQNTACIQFLDTPGSAAAITYKLKIYGSVPIALGATTGFFINRTTGDADQNYVTRATSQTILQEILP